MNDGRPGYAGETSAGSPFAGRLVVVGVSGGIAAYKTVELVSRLRKAGAEVRVVMTEAATRFVQPLTFHSLSAHPVLVHLLEEPKEWNVEHIALARRTELLIVAPATADVIGRMALGLADDYLTTFALAVTCPVLIAPAMNSNMYRHPAVQANLRRLAELGHEVMVPGTGFLAEGETGIGRMPEPLEIFQRASDILSRAAEERARAPSPGVVSTGGQPVGEVDGALTGRHVIVTAGGTREPLDPVRFIGNRSSGRMGFALAEAALARGARVTLIAAHTQVEPPSHPHLRLIRAGTTAELAQALFAAFDGADAVIQAAAVADFTPAHPSAAKIKKDPAAQRLVVELVKTPDVLAELGRRRRADQVLVGFAAETEHLLEHAAQKLRQKQVDLMVANDVSQPGAGFEVETNVVTLLWSDGRQVPLPPMRKRQVADRVLDEVAELLEARRAAGSSRGG